MHTKQLMVCMCVVQVCLWMHVQVCEHGYRGQGSTSGVVLQMQPTLGFCLLVCFWRSLIVLEFSN